uniref:NADH-ubiquinone oxidoreductase chain 6 n=1 Tax=Colponema vietnamica TaxID=1492817 RepID=V5KVH5_9ALVE|nr:NADH dehydrogenase subunit 6 [Colponema vietnamica]ATY40849.1 NADH dehydrogenase subunit 6 [Colponema vietnamica]
MFTQDSFFLLVYLLIGIILTSTVFISFFKNSVFSIFLLITIFTLSSVLLLCLNVDFTAFVVLSVYVGAIAVLFIFVLLLLNTKYLDDENEYLDTIHETFLQKNKSKFIIFFSAIIASLLIILPILDYFLIFIEFSNTQNLEYIKLLYSNLYIPRTGLENSNVNITAHYLYHPDFFGYYVVLSSVLLLVPMVGAIAITMERRSYIQRQDPIMQINRSANKTISFFK